MAKTFPKFYSHEVVSCFNCGGDLDGSQWQTSQNAKGYGQFVQHCEKCSMSTWYDIKQAKPIRWAI